MNSKIASVVHAILGLALLAGCANERPVEHVIANPYRAEKKAFEGIYAFQKTVSRVDFPGKDFGSIPAGYYVEQDKLVQFQIKENVLEVVSIDPLFHSSKDAKLNTTLASFPIEHVDVLRKQNADNEDTHEEEETTDRRVWQERQFIKVQIENDDLSAFKSETVVSQARETGIEFDPATGAINFVVTRRLKDDTLVDVRYSFLKFNEEGSTYRQKDYARDMQKKFGFFKTTSYAFDAHGRITQKTVKDFANRWDTSKPVVYYLSKDFPEHLKPTVRKVFANWNEAFKSATGKDVLVVNDWSGQELGDLRYSMIYYEASENASHRILGYGPSYTNPRTGEILKADVILYGGTLKRSLFSERIWEQLLERKNVPNTTSLPMSPPNTGAPISKTLEGGAFVELDDAHMNFFQVPALEMDQGPLAGSEVIDAQFLANLQANYTPQKLVSKLKAEIQDDLHKRFARVDADALATIQKAAHANGPISEEELEIQIFTPLLTHELGHNFGLRHNFLAAADKHHFHPGEQQSSVMDYGFLTSHEPKRLGQYDTAAIELLYGSNEEAQKKILADNFFFCTDEGVMDSRNSLCNRFIAGTSLKETVAHQVDRYQAAWVFNNLRLDRLHWNVSVGDYMNRILTYILPLRLVYDNAHAITEAAQGSDITALWYVTRQRIQADNSSDPKDVITIKVADGYETTIDSNISLKPSLVERKVDVKKVQAVIEDAFEAKLQAMIGFVSILLNDNNPLYSSGDQVHDELQVRGVIYDKLLALMMLISRTSDPSGSGAVITPFSTMENNVIGSFLNGILTNTAKTRNKLTGELSNQSKFYDVNLRQMALQLMIQELTVPGSSAKSREMLATELVNVDVDKLDQIVVLTGVLQASEIIKPLLEDKETPVNTQILATSLIQAKVNPMGLLQYVPELLSMEGDLTEAQRTSVLEALAGATNEAAQMEGSLSKVEKEYRAVESVRSQIVSIYSILYDKILSGVDPEKDPEIAMLQMALQSAQKRRTSINVAFAHRLGDTYFKSNVGIGRNFETSTGVLMRDNYNAMEDQQSGLLVVAQRAQLQLNAEMKKPEGDRDAALIKALQQKIARANSIADSMDNYLASEKLQMESFHQYYSEPN